MAIQGILRRWGNSIGVVVPSEILRYKNLEEGEEVIIEIEKISPIKKVFGSLRNWKINPQKLKDEIRKEEFKDE